MINPHLHLSIFYRVKRIDHKSFNLHHNTPQQGCLSVSFIIVGKETGKCFEIEYAGFYCVPIYQCNNDGLIRVAAQGLFDPRCRNVYCGGYYLSSSIKEKRIKSL